MNIWKLFSVTTTFAYTGIAAFLYFRAVQAFDQDNNAIAVICLFFGNLLLVAAGVSVVSVLMSIQKQGQGD